MRIRFLALVAILPVLGACAGDMSPEAQRDAAMASVCKSFSDALSTATVFKAKMSPDQVAAVDKAVEIAQPACHAFRGDPNTASEGTVNAVRDALRAIVLANQEVQS